MFFGKFSDTGNPNEVLFFCSRFAFVSSLLVIAFFGPLAAREVSLLLVSEGVMVINTFFT